MTHGIFPWIALFTPRWYINHWTSAGRMTRFYLWSLAVSVSLIDAYFATDHCQIICKRVKNKIYKSWWLLSTNTWFLSNCKYKACNLAVLQLLFDAFTCTQSLYLYSICKRLLWKSQAIPPCSSLKYFTHQTLQTYSSIYWVPVAKLVLSLNRHTINYT